jgi:hypothetical protein
MGELTIAVMDKYAYDIPGWLQTSIDMIIKCNHEKLKLRFISHFIEGGYAKHRSHIIGHND